MPQPGRPSRAFSLLELVIVVAILGILAAIAAPRLAGASQSSANASALASLRNLANAFAMYHEQNGDWPASALGGPTPNGMSEFMSDRVWAQIPALGERWVWINDPAVGVGVGMGVASSVGWHARWRDFDQRADDGVLNTGLIQAWNYPAPALVWILEDAGGALPPVLPNGPALPNVQAAPSVDAG